MTAVNLDAPHIKAEVRDMIQGSGVVTCIASALMFVLLGKPLGLVILVPAAVVVLCRYDALWTLLRHPTARGITKSGIAIAFGGLCLFFEMIAIAKHQATVDLARAEAVVLAVAGIGIAVVALLFSDLTRWTGTRR